ncbi:MAG: DUF2304 domain-containing protein [Coriobacteriia bacterium]|nr:DUF2304 domain-containing protein [Coriobacteriia bacterium]
MFLVVCALLVLVFMIRRIRKAEIHTRDTIFWFLLAACFVIIAAFPQIAFFLSRLLGIESPANFIFLFVIAVLFIREFTSTVEIAKLRERITTLAQELALAQAGTDNEDAIENRK